ncbi:hypothetical protein GIKK_44 [Gordonia phage GiKK]|nr:hypothetical protein GIKK_44 [Gordonia phage GiKK]UVK63936.1 hypothetical protein SEA_BUTTON_42 [Gordonia phage Button]WKW84835.1 hypothetical protein SEA_JAMZY_44 [Gordonia phage Jamzy]
MAVNNNGVTRGADPLKVKVDFTNVSEGSGLRTKRLPAGEYLAVIKDIEASESKAKNPQWVFKISPVSHPGCVYPYYVGLTAEQAWKLRAVLVACGATVPKKAITVDAKKLIGKKLGIILEDDEYDNKEKSVIDAVIPANEVDEDATAAAPDDEPAEDPEEEAAAPAEDPEDDDDLDLDDL